jgi:hypothetical protein
MSINDAVINSIRDEVSEDQFKNYNIVTYVNSNRQLVVSKMAHGSRTRKVIFRIHRLALDKAVLLKTFIMDDRLIPRWSDDGEEISWTIDGFSSTVDIDSNRNTEYLRIYERLVCGRVNKWVENFKKVQLHESCVSVQTSRNLNWVILEFYQITFSELKYFALFNIPKNEQNSISVPCLVDFVESREPHHDYYWSNEKDATIVFDDGLAVEFSPDDGPKIKKILSDYLLKDISNIVFDYLPTFFSALFELTRTNN